MHFRIAPFALVSIVTLAALGRSAPGDTTNTPPVPQVAPQAETPAVSEKDLAEHLIYRFDACVFDSVPFPGGSFEQDALVRHFLGPIQVGTTFYNAQFQEVKQADAPGRYGAVVRIKLGDGTELTRFVTLYRSPKKLFWRTAKFGLSMTLPPEWGIDPLVARHHHADMERILEEILWTSSAQSTDLAILLAGLSEMAPGDLSDVERTDSETRDATWWFQLKTRLGLEKAYPYLVYLPDGYDANPGKRWPLILFLHGSGERGDSLPKVSTQGLPKLIAQGQKFPAIIISPQCPEHDWWQVPNLSQLLDDVSAKYRVDPDRISVTGLSMGGFGAWSLALAYPARFAAIAPICGGGDPSDAARLKKLPIWAFHGGKDDTVPTEMTIRMVQAVRAAGGHPHLTIFPNDGHNSWTDAYNTEALYPWLLAQERGHGEVATPGVPARWPSIQPWVKGP